MTKKKWAENPLRVRVQTEEQASETAFLCNDRNVHFIMKINPNEPPDLADLERLDHMPQPIAVAAKPGRNDPCSCGSGVKFKKCHGQ